MERDQVGTQTKRDNHPLMGHQEGAFAEGPEKTSRVKNTRVVGR